jgi:predicted nucleotidyltransferase
MSFFVPIFKALNDAVIFDVNEVSIRVCGLDDLIQLKQLAGRPRDMDDIQKLQMISQNERD